MARKVGVFCRGCGKGIEIDDDCVPGIRGVETAASFYRPFFKAGQGKTVDSAIRPWHKTLTCENPDCVETHTYGTDDLRLFDDS